MSELPLRRHLHGGERTPHHDVDRPPVLPTAVDPDPTIELPPAGEDASGRSRSTLAQLLDAKALGAACLAFAAAVAAVLAFVLVLSRLDHDRSQTELERRFSQQLLLQQSPVSGSPAAGTPVALLQVPRLGLREVVVEGTRPSQLSKGPGHLPGTPFPGQRGSSVIVGRRLGYGGPFRSIGSLRQGDTITLTTGQTVATYKVTGKRSVGNGEPLELDAANRLTLVTADPPLSASRLLVVDAQLASPVAPTRLGATVVQQASVGLGGDGSAALPLLLWLEVLLAASLGWVWLRRRWARWPAHLVCVPVMLAVGWLSIEELVRLLPAAL